jgi:putative MATE family efflux protein
MNLFPVNNYYKKILHLSLPAIAGLSTQMVVSLVDAAMVGRLDNAKYALAAMGLGVMATWAVVSFFSSLATGTHVLTARKFGKSDFNGCSQILINSIYIAVFVGVLVIGCGLFLVRPVAHFFSADPIVGYYTGEYIFYRLLGLPFFLVSVSYRGFFFGISKTKIFMFSGIITNVLNIFFNSLLIYGNWGFPRMGLAGAALGSSLATSFDFIFYLTITLLPKYRSRYRVFSNLKFNFPIIKEIYKLALPVSFQNIFILLGFLSFMAITGLIGTKEQAASQAVVSSLFMSIMPCFGFGIAAQTLVGNNLGVGKLQLAKIYGFETAKIATYYTLFLGILFISIPQYVLLIITTDQSIIQTAVPALRVAGFAQIFYAVGVVLSNGLQSAGETLFVMLAESLTNLLVFVPLAYFFGVYLGLGLTMAWVGLPIYIITYSFVIWRRFRKGKWDFRQ